MKNADSASERLKGLLQGMQWLFDGPLRQSDAVIVASGGNAHHTLRHGFHSHDSWELFAPISGRMRFEVAGRPSFQVSPGKLLLIPPGCLHMPIHLLPQSPKLRLIVMDLPGEQANYGALRVGAVVRDRLQSNLGADDLSLWTQLIGEPPATVMNRAGRALGGSVWSRECALGALRMMIAAYAEILANPQPQNRRAAGVRRVTEALSYLQTHYYQPDLTLVKVAAAVNLSPSHLSNLFQQVTGRGVRQALIDIRLRRALALLQSEEHTIKEISALTGWSSQLYFSAAFRKRYGQSPSAVSGASDLLAEK